VVSSAFVIDIHPNLQPDLNEQSSAILYAILLTLNQSAIQGGIITVTGLLYAGLLISLFAAFVDIGEPVLAEFWWVDWTLWRPSIQMQRGQHQQNR